MQDNSKGSVGPDIPENYNGLVEAPMQGYSKGSVSPFTTVHYNG
jgi:hypothetical protein